ncbi:diguanylate cyclase [Mycobacterium sp. SMC-4]|uniref:GGDEF domain-containing protein n=1 Tax=Mycobacterium sp. SMC-4 TaxID=2857059 RepID=UPI0021B36123|nr:GGDEF domain-containing protein [Mycobacterium sp. SMC-4]UXA18087.1 GGDEF domain-containing protein [Mycobacterium sp. SMC-4]
MSQGLFAVIDLGSFTLIGIGLGFVVLWLIDRSRVHALLFAAAILFWFASNWVLSLSGDIALSSSIHGILLPIGFVLLADGLLRRSGERFESSAAIVVIVGLAAVVWYFAYVSPLLTGRVIAQNVCLGVLLLFTIARVWMRCRRRPSDLLIVIATLLLSAGLFLNVVLVLVSDLPPDLTTDSAIDEFAKSPVAFGITVVGAVILPMVMLALLAAIVIDLVGDLRFERDCDELTGLLNRRGFTERAAITLRSAASGALILADLDFFKQVNDELGHAGGDFALTTFAELLRSAPDISQVTGRIGGEEFAVLAPNAGTAEAFVFAESVRSRLAAQTISYGGADTSLTASFGVATATAPVSLHELMDAADRALYEAKALGRNCTAIHQPR